MGDAQLRHAFDDPRIDLERDTRLVVDRRGRIVAFVAAIPRQEASREARAFVFGDVHPESRGQGLGWALVRWARDRAVELLRDRSPGVPIALYADGPIDALDRIRLLEDAGFETVRYFTDMERMLDDGIEPRTLPDGLRAAGWAEGAAGAVRDAHNAAFLDHWNFQPWDAQSWSHNVTDAPGLLPEATSIALAGAGDARDEVAGYVIVFDSTDGHPDGRPSAELAIIGVRREHRGRGLASALITRSLEALSGAGYVRAELDVDAANSTGAVTLYERLGFRPVRRSVLLRYSPPPEE
jgi:mycothiol synthase